eukprot:10010995-Heterocapsa_arctica.AAC.1
MHQGSTRILLDAVRARDVGDVVPRVAVERLLEAQLVEVVADEAHGAAEHEEAVQGAEGHE